MGCIEAGLSNKKIDNNRRSQQLAARGNKMIYIILVFYKSFDLIYIHDLTIWKEVMLSKDRQ